MADALKNAYNRDSLREVALDIQSVYSPFQAAQFLESVVDETWADLELKDRTYRISEMLGRFLPSDYAAAIGIIDKVVMNYGTWLTGFGWFFPIFVELYGQDEVNWDISMAALARYTPYASAELAVRPFIMKHEERMMAQMTAWAVHEDECVRRLASPALPWAPALSSFKKAPAPILPILTMLKTDPSIHVRKSVANNLNDISKTHPDLVAQLAKDWHGKHERTDWIVKHGCRTLLKQGNREVLAIFGYESTASVAVDGFVLEADTVALGADIAFSFSVSAREAAKVRLEYGIDYVKSNGKRTRKIFQISEVSLKENQKKLYTKTHSFADISTRKHYPGLYSITLIANGAAQSTLDFELTV